MSDKNSIIEKYQKTREIGQQVNGEILKEATRDDFIISARALGLFKANKILVKSEEDIDRVYDFTVHDYRNKDGKNLVEIYSEKHPELTEDESNFINVSLASSSSLFKVVAIDSVNHTFELQDLLQETDNVVVTDVGLSSNAFLQDFIIYSRIFRFDDFNTTSGAALLFEPHNQSVLMKKYKSKMEKIKIGDRQTKLAAAFFVLFRTYGFFNMAYKDVEELEYLL